MGLTLDKMDISTSSYRPNSKVRMEIFDASMFIKPRFNDLNSGFWMAFLSEQRNER